MRCHLPKGVVVASWRAAAVVMMLLLYLLDLEGVTHATQFTPLQLWHLREDAREMAYHAYDSYMAHAFPWDELRPLTCEGRRWDRRERGDLDDALGGYAMTLVDSLDMLAIMGDYAEFRRAVRLVLRTVSFDRDVTVSVFEATIRVLGGLLSAHTLAADPELGVMDAGEYDGGLLRLAEDLGSRLLPAFDTASSIPVHRVNLARGVPSGEKEDTCTAAAGTLLVEMGLLSRLTGRPEFEAAAKGAVKALWARRSSLDLVGATVNTRTGQWQQQHTGIGAGVDSFYEYLLKAHVLLGDADLLDMFNAARSGVNQHMLFGDLHMEVSMELGRAAPRPATVSSLQAFWPAVEVLAGDVEGARAMYRPLAQLWRQFEMLPEQLDLASRRPVHFAKDSPLRPELLESTYHLYLATRDPAYLRRGAAIMDSIQRYSKVRCGYASVADVSTKRLDDRMDSYFISETVKYLFLLFDSALTQQGRGGAAANASATGAAAATDGAHLASFVPGDVEVVVDANRSPGSSVHPRADDGPSPGRETSGVCTEAGGTGPQPCTRANLSATATGSRAGGAEARGARALEAQSLARRVRNGRSPLAAMPFDDGEALFTTEGHILLLASAPLVTLEAASCPNHLARAKASATESHWDADHSCAAWSPLVSTWFSDLGGDWQWQKRAKTAAAVVDNAPNHRAGAQADHVFAGLGVATGINDPAQPVRATFEQHAACTKAMAEAARAQGAQGKSPAATAAAEACAHMQQTARVAAHATNEHAGAAAGNAATAGTGGASIELAEAAAAAPGAVTPSAATGPVALLVSRSPRAGAPPGAVGVQAESVALLVCAQVPCGRMPTSDPCRPDATCGNDRDSDGDGGAAACRACSIRSASALVTIKRVDGGSLVTGSPMRAVTASFGPAPPAEQSPLAGALVAASPAHACEPVVSATPVPARDDHAASVLAVLRGGCSFVTKVRNAQHAGYAAVVVLSQAKAGQGASSGETDTGAAAADGGEEGDWASVMGDGGADVADLAIPAVMLHSAAASELAPQLWGDAARGSSGVGVAFAASIASDVVDPPPQWAARPGVVSGEVWRDLRAAAAAATEALPCPS